MNTPNDNLQSAGVTPEDYERLALDLAQSRYNLGLSSIVEYSQAELQKTEADITDTDAVYQFHQSQRFLQYTLGSLK